jgi:hypothetical protein
MAVSIRNQTEASFGARCGAAGSIGRRPTRTPLRALPQLRLDQLPLPPWLGGQRGKASSRDPLQAQREELLDILVPRAEGASGGRNGRAQQEQEQQARASELVDELMASGLPFQEARLGGGPWVVVYTRGAPQL